MNEGEFLVIESGKARGIYYTPTWLLPCVEGDGQDAAAVLANPPFEGERMEPKLIKRSTLADARGWLYEGVRTSQDGTIAQVYVTCCYPGVVKGWHRHALQTDRMICVSGMARIVTCDAEWKINPYFDPESEYARYVDCHNANFQECVIGPLAEEKVAIIPPGLWHAFTPCGNESCVIVNAPDREYDGTDEERLELKAIPYEWKDVSR